MRHKRKPFSVLFLFRMLSLEPADPGACLIFGNCIYTIGIYLISQGNITPAIVEVPGMNNAVISIWAENAALPFLLLHLGISVILLGAITHHAIRVLRGTETVTRHGARYARWTVVTYALSVLSGAVVYPAFRYYCRYLLFDAHLRGVTATFEIKEHLAALGLALLPFYYFSSKDITKLSRFQYFSHGFSVLVLAGIVWYTFLGGAAVTIFKGPLP